MTKIAKVGIITRHPWGTGSFEGSIRSSLKTEQWRKTRGKEIKNSIPQSNSDERQQQ